jgi:endogenous inhibitor of DNA gyrase (YacG/DUF329 family)
MRDRDQKKTPPHRRWQYTCPICKRRVTVSQGDPAQLPPYFPFCSERCKLIDLGAWLDADYRISGKPDEEAEHPPGEGPPPETEDARKPDR